MSLLFQLVPFMRVAPISVRRANHPIPEALKKLFHGSWIMAAFLVLSMPVFGAVGLPIRVVQDGDSIFTTSTTGGDTVFEVMSNTFWTSASISFATNAANSGDSIGAVASGYVNQIQRYKPSGGTNAIFFLEGGNNDVTAGQTGVQIVNSYSNACIAAKADGFIVVIFTITECTCWDAGQLAAVEYANNQLKTNSSAWADYVIDADGLLPPHPNTAIWLDDRHWTPLAHRIVATNLFQTVPLFARIESESAVTTTASAEYSTTVWFRPNGDTVTYNPPVFHWCYSTNNLTGGEQNPGGEFPHWATQTNAFQFQIATQSNFGGTLAVDVNTPFNFYNTLSPLSTNATRQFWWRVQWVTGGVAYCTSKIYTFTVANGATNWDRSMLADTNYFATNNVKPLFCFRAGEEAAIWTDAQTHARSFMDLTNAATAATNAAYFHTHHLWGTNTTPEPSQAVAVTDGFGRANNLSAVLFLWKFSGDNRWTNASMTGWLLTNIYHNVHWFLNPSNNYAMLDYGDSQSAMPVRLVIATYDWLHTYLGSDTGTFNGQLRTNALHAGRLISRFWIGNDLWTATPFPTGGYIRHYDWNYRDRTNYCNPAGTLEKQGNSHGAISLMIAGFPTALVMGEDDEEIKLLRNLILNYMVGKTTPFGGWAANHIGVYGYVDNHVYNRSLISGLQILHVTYPQVQIQRTDFCAKFPEWWTRFVPYNMRKYHGPYGDGIPTGNFSYYFGLENRGLDLALLTGSGYARQLYDLNREYSNTFWAVSSHFDELPLRYHFTLPAAATNTPAAIYPEDGMVSSSSGSPSEFGSYTNQFGFSIYAPPRGFYQNHNVAASGSIDLWAYGTQITDGGGDNLNPLGYHSDGNIGLFVNGYGVSGSAGADQSYYAKSQLAPMESRIVNYANGGWFTYVCVDLTGSFTNAYHPLTVVTRVRRHIVQLTNSPAWLICDEFTTSSNCTFGVRWQIPWAFRYEVSSAALANETQFTGDRYGSNSYARTTNGFTYTAGNYADSGYANPPRVPVTVTFANNTNQFGIFEAVGTNKLFHGTNVVLDASATNSTLNPFLNRTLATVNPDRAVGLWITNSVAATNFQFVYTVTFQVPGQSAPTVARESDKTVSLVNLGVATVGSFFETNASPASTFIVDTSSASENPGGPPEEGSGIGSAILRGVIMRGAYVK